MRFVFLSLCCGLLFFAVWYSSRQSLDREIEDCLKELFTSDFGYCLIDEKPAALDSCNCLMYYKEKRIFKYLENLFKKSGRFILKIDYFYDDFYSITLINKKILAKTIDSEPSLKAFVKRKFGCIENLFHELQNPTQEFFSCFDNDPVIVGMVLGYGEENSKFFSRRCKVARALNEYPFVNLFLFDLRSESLQNHLPQTYFLEMSPARYPSLTEAQRELLENDWEVIKQELFVPNSTSPPILFQFPVFVTRKSTKTTRLLNKYKVAQDKLSKIFCNKSFIETLQSFDL